MHTIQGQVHILDLAIFICALLLASLILSMMILHRMKVQFKSLRTVLNDTVRERTAILRDRNNKLQEYANINAHYVRGPVARILGLIHLIDINAVSETEAYPKIRQCAFELDEIVRTININLAVSDEIIEGNQGL